LRDNGLVDVGPSRHLLAGKGQQEQEGFMSSMYSEEALSSGPSAGEDPTLVHAQYPASLFGWDLPQTTGAPGTEGARLPTGGQTVDFTDSTGRWQGRPETQAQLSGAGDSTTAPGQTTEGLSGASPSFVADTGAGHGTVQTTPHPNAS
jgi:hypothetical protein